MGEAHASAAGAAQLHQRARRLVSIGGVSVPNEAYAAHALCIGARCLGGRGRVHSHRHLRRRASNHLQRGQCGRHIRARPGLRRSIAGCDQRGDVDGKFGSI